MEEETKSVWQASQDAMKEYGTLNNTYDMFPVGTKVKIITHGQDMTFFYGETGKVTRNTGGYLGIKVKFDEPRKARAWEGQTEFSFEPKDLYIWDKRDTGKKGRGIVTADQVTEGINELHIQVEVRLKEKGRQSWKSRHEVLGVVAEEYQELIEAVRNGGGAALCHELMDIAVAALYGYINVKNNKTDW